MNGETWGHLYFCPRDGYFVMDVLTPGDAHCPECGNKRAEWKRALTNAENCAVDVIPEFRANREMRRRRDSRR